MNSKNYLGIDTSNYRSSCAVYNADTDTFTSFRKLLPVRHGELGLRQSNAVFYHTQNLPSLLVQLLEPVDAIKCASSSYAPRDCDGSYMPCFSVGVGYSRILAAAYNAKEFKFSHQAGHVAAALYSSGQTNLIGKEFIAFHVSGGTTDVLHIKPSTKNIFEIDMLATSLDLKAGQAVDRVGIMLGTSFPAGVEIDELANQSEKKYKIKPYTKNGCCSFSGLENKCKQMHDNNEFPCNIAKYCIDYITEAVRIMTHHALSEVGNLPVIYAGGVMSNTIINKTISSDFGGYFASPEFSGDNACGTAYLGYIKEQIND